MVPSWYLSKKQVQEEIVAYVRRRSSAFSRGRSAFRGVSGQNSRWEARVGSFQGKKNVSSKPVTATHSSP